MRKRVIFALMFIVVMLLLNSCGTTEKRERSAVIRTDKNKDYATILKGVSFKDEAGRLTINNQTSFDLIIFAGRVENGNVLGGIYASKSRSFDLSKIPGLQNSGCILIRAATVDHYINKNLKLREEDVIYSGLVVYDLKSGGDRTNLNIYAGIDTSLSTSVYVTNKSPNYVLELRLDHPNGDKVATIPPNMENKAIYLSPKMERGQIIPYRFWPTYVYVDSSTNEMKSFVSNDRADTVRAIPRGGKDKITPMVFEAPTISSIGYKVGFIRVKNDTDEGLVFYDGATFLPDQKGVAFTESGYASVYELESSVGESGTTYTNLKFDHDKGAVTKIQDMIIKPGYMYELIVTKKSGNFGYDYRELPKRDLLEDSRIRIFLE